MRIAANLSNNKQHKYIYSTYRHVVYIASCIMQEALALRASTIVYNSTA
jgi:hypothetical protein